MTSSYREYQRHVERRRLGREAQPDQLGHVRIYGHGEHKHAVVLEEHEPGKSVAQHVFEDPEVAKQHLAQIVGTSDAIICSPLSIVNIVIANR